MHDSTKLAPGTLFAGEYQILRRLSGGGMGVVYVAEQKSTGVERALKVMNPGLVRDEKLRERFAQEARAGARIPSDHVVQVIGAGVEIETGTPWIAMELLEGRSLAEHVEDEGPLSAADTLRIFRQLCHAVGAAHEQGIVHRDLKPENVFLAVSRQAFEDFTVKVLDFGLAKVLNEAKAKQTDALGTPLWMAPEQAELGGEISAQTDVWALGLIAFYVLTGHDYWKTAAQDSPNVPAIIREVLFDPFDPPSVRARELGVLVTLPEGFDAWFARSVTRATDARFPDAAQALRELEPILIDAAGTDALSSIHPSPLSVRVPTSSPRQGERAHRLAEAATVTAHARVGFPIEERARPWRGGLVAAGALATLAGAVLLVRFVPSVRSTLPESVLARLPATIFGPASPSASAGADPSPPGPVRRTPAPPRAEAVGPTLPPAPPASRVAPGDPKVVAARPGTGPERPEPFGGSGAEPEPTLPSAPPAGRAFPREAANAAVRVAADAASACRSDEGGAKVTVTVVWGTSGSPHATPIANAPAGTESCIRSHFASLTIPPFEGAVEAMRVSFDVGR